MGLLNVLYVLTFICFYWVMFAHFTWRLLCL